MVRDPRLKPLAMKLEEMTRHIDAVWKETPRSSVVDPLLRGPPETIPAPENVSLLSRVFRFLRGGGASRP